MTRDGQWKMEKEVEEGWVDGFGESEGWSGGQGISVYVRAAQHFLLVKRKPVRALPSSP